MKDLLEKILEEKNNRLKLIKQFHEQIWNGYNFASEREDEILSELAEDLDYYEPNEKLRIGKPEFFGDEGLEQKIKEALQLLDK